MAQRQHRKHNEDRDMHLAPLHHGFKCNRIPKNRLLNLGLGQAAQLKVFALALHMLA